MPSRFVRQRRKQERPITFVSVMEAFQPQIKVRFLKDVSGWASRDRRVKWSIGAGKVGTLDADKAREFQAKGYLEILDGTVKPVTQTELDEILATVTVVGL